MIKKLTRKKRKLAPVQTVNFGTARQYGGARNYGKTPDDVPVFDRGRSSRRRFADDEPDEFDVIAGNFGDWGDQ